MDTQISRERSPQTRSSAGTQKISYKLKLHKSYLRKIVFILYGRKQKAKKVLNKLF